MGFQTDEILRKTNPPDRQAAAFAGSRAFGRAVTLSLIYAGGLHLAFFLTSFMGGSFWWGINYWSYFPGGISILLFTLPLLLALGGLAGTSPRGGHRREDPSPRRPGPQARPRRAGRRWLPVVPLAVAPLVFWALRDRTHLLGDGLLILAETRRANAFSETAPLANRILLGASSILGGGEGGTERALALASVMAGFFYLVLVWFLCQELLGVYGGGRRPQAREEGAGTKERWLAFLLFLLHPSLLWFCGYIEFYPIVAVFALLVILLSLLAMRGRIPRWVPVAAWVVSVGCHVFLLLYFPLILAVTAFGGDKRPREQPSGKSRPSRVRRGPHPRPLLPSPASRIVHLIVGLLGGVGITSLAGVGPVEMLRGVLRPGQGGAFLHLRVSDAMTEAYGIFEAGHLVDIANEVFLLMPLLPLIPLWALAHRPLGRGRTAALLAAVAVPALLPLFIANPRLGMARDWGLMGLPSLPVNLLALHLILGVSPGEERRRRSRWFRVLIFFLLGCGGVRTGSWIYLHHHPRLAEERAVLLAAEARLSSPFARSYFHEDLSFHLERRGDFEGARVQAERALELRPDHSRLAYNLGLEAFRRQEFEAARDAFIRAVELDPDNAAALNNLGVTFRALGEIDEAERVFGLSAELAPADPMARANLALIRLEKGDIGGALARALELRGLRLDENTRGALEVVARALEAQGFSEEAATVRTIGRSSLEDGPRVR